ncbi:hypothetical protein M0802_013124 [Mischocyttarus mexicanus]|nr:hypothetical protein M0802_013124 [Mischocyttarus mexicanus]
MADFNARNIIWNNTITNDRERHLANWVNNNSIKYKVVRLSLNKLTYPKTGCFLDQCIMDIRVQIDDFLYAGGSGAAFNTFAKKCLGGAPCSLIYLFGLHKVLASLDMLYGSSCPRQEAHGRSHGLLAGRKSLREDDTVLIT